MTLKYVKHEPISLRQLGFSENWLHERIKEDPSILKLGDLDILKHELVQAGGGRLDLLLADIENEMRYEVEIMLGPTDPSHIVRCIEYWDVERRRYPAYDHVAVLIAEDITSRFLNVMSLLLGSIPLIAIQLNALRIGDQVILDFVKVLDQSNLRQDIETEAEEDADRSSWDAKTGAPIMQICDRIASIANEVANPKLELKYKKRHVALSVSGKFFNAIGLYPKKAFVKARVNPSESEVWLRRLDDADLEPQVLKNGRLQFRIRSQELREHEALLRDLIHQVVKEHQSG